MSRPQTRASRVAAVGSSFWLIPAVFAILAVALAGGLSALETRLALLPAPNLLPSGPQGARQLLASIITAMITFTALVFTTTLVALQLASSQYSPRILRTFLQDRIVQMALGTFIATFLFAMLVLAALPAKEDRRLPVLSLTLSMALILVSSGVFIYYLHHLTTIIRISHVIASIGAQTRHAIDRHYPVGHGPSEAFDLGPVEQVLPAPSPGILTDIDLNLLARIARRHHCTIAVLPTPGDFVVEGAPLVTVHRRAGEQPRPPAVSDIEKAINVGPERSPGQDVGFGFRQLADIAVRALSPALNDITTAIRATQEMHDLLRRLANRQSLPRLARDDDGTVRVRVKRQGFDGFLAVAVDEVGHAGRDQPCVLRYLTVILDDLAAVATSEYQPAIQQRLRAASPQSAS